MKETDVLPCKKGKKRRNTTKPKETSVLAIYYKDTPSTLL